METNNNNLAWKILMMFSVLFFGFFICFHLLKNRKHSYSTELSNSENDQENMSNDWKNVFGDMHNAFNKMKK